MNTLRIDPARLNIWNMTRMHNLVILNKTHPEKSCERQTTSDSNAVTKDRSHPRLVAFHRATSSNGSVLHSLALNRIRNDITPPKAPPQHPPPSSAPPPSAPPPLPSSNSPHPSA